MSEKTELIHFICENKRKIKKNISNVIVGQDEIIENILIALFSNGHVLIVGVPGLAKTLIISSLAKVLNLKFSRIQFTPDLMPSDITGYDILNQADGKKIFEFSKGPIFSNIVLADEINRAPSKTQSALLEAMQERKVTVSGKTYPLEKPFIVFATQNPIEQEGTYNLPEAQLDRFLLQLNIKYPSFEEEKKIASKIPDYDISFERIMSAEEICQAQNVILDMPVADSVIDYAVSLVVQTRPEMSSIETVKKFVLWGAGPRASQFLVLASKAKAALDGRYTPSIEDVKYMAKNVLRHRIILNFNAISSKISVDEIIEDILSK